MDNSNFWDWDNEDEHRVSLVYRDTADETKNAAPTDIERSTEIQNHEKPTETMSNSEAQNHEKPTDTDNCTQVHTIKVQNNPIQADAMQNPTNNFILVDNPQNPTQDTNPQNETSFAQTQYQQTDYQQTQHRQNDFQQIIPVQNTQQNQDTDRQNAKQDFDPKDISENKVSAMAAYLLGPLGIIIALLIARDSAYTAFHVRQALKLTVCSVALEIIAAILALFGMIPLVGIIFKLVLVMIVAIWLGVLVLRLTAIAQVCDGEAREPVIIAKMNCFH